MVLEDLTNEEELSPVLKHVQGLVLLASCKALTYSKLPRLVIEQKLQHITAKQLAKNGCRREANKRFQYFSEQLEKEMGLEPLSTTQTILST